ncbi:hypothetical protein A4H97_16350 [Niastella yeongjuensis]|uniref:AB hydrolase-1 domain-containing protein n=1 Tax=Niastella yeongjuensis TaxID=354355 RepID=A0A1V9E0Y6_9BACT|nr:alpha/beta hydrolase [Niastella yeongjuensis]OQP39793.1 hypothetical protein A4H97_16350 [Niastella yeongjuensis]SEO05632.1 alpha/beta hydrolase fold [Niastella yeongjuensis]
MDNWDPELTDGLAKTHRVILFDNRGVGSSEGEAPETIDAMANDAIAFIHALGLKKVDMLGFSLGAFIAQKIVINEPALVNKLILAGTGPEGGDITDNGPVIENKEKLTPQQMLLHLFYDTAAISQTEGKAAIARLGQRTVNRDANTKVPSILAQNKAIEAFNGRAFFYIFFC